MARTLALFPLQIVTFPGEKVNLHIFEPRYRQLVQDCEEHGITFGIPAFIDGAVQPYGTEMVLKQVAKRYDNGESDIVTYGRGLFRIKEFFPQLSDRLYAGALVDDVFYDVEEDLQANADILRQMKAIFRIMQIDKPLPESLEDFHTFQVGHYLGFSLEQEYELLTTRDAGTRQQLILEQLARITPMVNEVKSLEERAKLNGHFRKLSPPMF